MAKALFQYRLPRPSQKDYILQTQIGRIPAATSYNSIEVTYGVLPALDALNWVGVRHSIFASDLVPDHSKLAKPESVHFLNMRHTFLEHIPSLR